MTPSPRILAMLAASLVLLGAAPAQAADDAALSLDVYAIPSAPLVAAVDRASGDLAALGMTTFRARGQGVHATLYLTRYRASAVPRLRAAVARLARGRRPFALALGGIERTASNWLFLKLERTPALQRLADEVTLAAEPLRDHAVQAPGWMRDYPAKLPAFERYGSPNVFMQFDPHLTLLANETNPALAAFAAGGDPHRYDAQGEVAGIGLAEVDANGQIVRTIAEYRFRR